MADSVLKLDHSNTLAIDLKSEALTSIIIQTSEIN
jgi:hypothetical protein